LRFDPEREEIKLNPALEGFLGTEALEKWQTARDDLLALPNIRAGDVMDGFGDLATPRGRTLPRLPSPDAKGAGGVQGLVPCGALFNVEFAGQAISQDLRQMRGVPPLGTGLEAMLRLSDVPAPASRPPAAEVDRFRTVESDPSQDIAIASARLAPGLLIEGPPGTGKSQTIVGIVADAIGRNETVLIVCQKQAALRVVQKRLEAEGLGERLFAVIDVSRDREAIVRALRDQLEHVREISPG